MKCIATWHHFMPDYEYKLWNEDNFDVDSVQYTKEAYKVRKFAFVSDYVRLWALEREGGIYLDVDFQVYKSFDSLLHLKAFAGFEGSKHSPLMMGMIASEAHGEWISEQLHFYQSRIFLNAEGLPDLTTNVQFVTAKMRERGFVQNGEEQDYKDLHVFPVEFFCPKQTTGEYFRTENTYCEQFGKSSWEEENGCWKKKFGKLIGQKSFTRLIKLKRKMFG